LPEEQFIPIVIVVFFSGSWQKDKFLTLRRSPPIKTRDSSNPKSFLQFLLPFLFLGLMLLAFGWFFREDFPWHLLQGLSWTVPALGFGAYSLMHLLEGAKLQALLRQLGHSLPYWPAVYNALGGFVFTGITPMAAGGQAFQITHLSRMGIPRGTAMNLILGRIPQHVFTSFLTILLGSPLLIMTLSDYAPWEIALMGLGLIVSLFSALILFLVLRGARTFHRKTMGVLLALPLPWKGRILRAWYRQKRALTDLEDSFRQLWTHRLRYMLWDSLLSWLITLGQALSLYGAFALLGLEIELITTLYLYVLLGMVVFFVPTPGASGSIELSFASLMGGSDFFPTLMAVLGWRIGSYYLQLVLGGPLVFGAWKKQRREMVTRSRKKKL
jgi:uncharacterized protein (TIRG00374 family)